MRYLYFTVLVILGIAALVSGCGKSEEEYKKVAVQVNYEELSRKPDNYKGKPLAFADSIVNVKGNGKDAELLFASGQTPILVHYSSKGNEERFLANDFVRVWGDFQKVSNKKLDAMMPEISVIEVDAKYISRPAWASLVGFTAITSWVVKINGKPSPIDEQAMRLSLDNIKVNENNITMKGTISYKYAVFQFKGMMDDNGVGEFEYTDDKGNPKNIKGKIVLKNKDDIEIETPKIEQAKRSMFVRYGESPNTLITLEEGKYTLTLMK